MGNDLEKKLDQYDRIFLFCSDTGWFEAVFAGSEIVRESDKKIWVYSGNEIVYPESIPCRHISSDEEKKLLNLYHTYEFSNRFHVISMEKIYGSLFNYIEQGLLSESELIKSLLY